MRLNRLLFLQRDYMKLRTKLKVAFIIMAALPIILGAIAIYIVINRQLNQIKITYGIEGDYKFSDLYSSGAILSSMTDSVYDELQSMAVTDPARLTDSGFIEDLSGQLNTKLSSLVVMEGNNITYSSSPLDRKQLRELLPDPELAGNLGSTGLYKGGEFKTLVKAVNFTNAKGQSSAVYILTPMNQIIPQLRNLMIEAFIIIIEVMAFTSFILYFWINRSVIKPIDRLRLGTQNIKNGNLDFEIKSVNNDEFGDLYKDFEEMRMRLNRSALEKEKSDIEEKELIRNISHDLKTPLTAVKGYVEGLRDGIADTPEKQKKYIITISNKVEDMDRLIDELTLFSRLDTNRIPYEMVKINVKDYFDDCVEELDMDLGAQDITLKYAFYGDESMEIKADPNQLKRVISNIVSNSVKYKSPDRPCVIEISVFDEGDYIHVELTDNGKGINMKDIPRVFDRFYRSDESRTSPQSGSGIGLAIVKKIIEDHKGRIWVDSVEGEGTTFHINLLRYKEGMQLSLPDNQIKSRKKKKKEQKEHKEQKDQKEQKGGTNE